MFACRKTNTTTLVVAANAPRQDVLYLTGPGNTPHNANGVGWYFDPSSSFGFAPEGDPIDRTPCDFLSGDNRICVHGFNATINHTVIPYVYFGYRCGNFTRTAANSFERVFYETDNEPPS